MKRLFFSTALVAFILMGSSSCRKCEICTKTNSNEIRVCEKDYNNNTAYGLVIDTYEAGGYSCD